MKFKIVLESGGFLGLWERFSSSLCLNSVYFSLQAHFSFKKTSKSTKNDLVKKVLLIFFWGILTTLYQFLERIFLYKLICISYSWKFSIKSSVINTAKKIFLHFWRSDEKIIGYGMKDDVEHRPRGFPMRITRFWDSLGSI